jgi:hypothetical protein
MSINWPRRVRELGLFAAAGLFLAVINPFNATPGAGFWLRAAYWIFLIAAGGYSAEAGRRVFDRIWPRSPLPVTLAAISIMAAMTVTAALVGIEYALNGHLYPLRNLPSLFGFVWIISAAMTAVGFMADRSILSPPPATAPEGSGPAETFLSRLPLKFRQADLYAISSEDHYLRVHTSLGEELILMRLADAVRELDGAGGLQVHRSWWVAASAVRDVNRTGGRMALVLPSGKQVPVSRTYAAAVRDAGLI